MRRPLVVVSAGDTEPSMHLSIPCPNCKRYFSADVRHGEAELTCWHCAGSFKVYASIADQPAMFGGDTPISTEKKE